MKREEAEKLFEHAYREPVSWNADDPLPKPLRQRLIDALLSAYRKGEEDMRERCAAALDKRRSEIHSDRELDELHAGGQAEAYAYQEQEFKLERMAKRIRRFRLSRTEDSNDQPRNPSGAPESPDTGQ